MKTFTFAAQTPEGVVKNEEVEYVVLPTEEGGYGVLKNHAPVLLCLNSGFIELTQNGIKDRLFIMGGVADVTKDKVTVLADFIAEEDALQDALKEREAYFDAEKERRKEAYHAYKQSGVELNKALRKMGKRPQNIG